VSPLAKLAEDIEKMFGKPSEKGSKIYGPMYDYEATGQNLVDALLKAAAKYQGNHMEDEEAEIIQHLADEIAQRLQDKPQISIYFDPRLTLGWAWTLADGTHSEEWFWTKEECIADLAERQGVGQ
jgi:hypothetical protein